MALSDSALSALEKDNKNAAILAEASNNCHNYMYSSFICLLALSSVVGCTIESYFPIAKEKDNAEDETVQKGSLELMFNTCVLPRHLTMPVLRKIHIFRCASSPIDFVQAQQIPENKDHYVSLLQLKETTSRKGKGQTNHALPPCSYLPKPPALLTDEPGSTENQRPKLTRTDSHPKPTKCKQLTLEELTAKRFAAESKSTNLNRESVANVKPCCTPTGDTISNLPSTTIFHQFPPAHPAPDCLSTTIRSSSPATDPNPDLPLTTLSPQSHSKPSVRFTVTVPNRRTNQ